MITIRRTCSAPAVPIRRRANSRSTAPRAGEVVLPCLVILVVLTGICCLAALASSPPAFRRCGAAIDRLLADTVDEWLAVDTLTVPWLRPVVLPWGDALCSFGMADLALDVDALRAAPAAARPSHDAARAGQIDVTTAAGATTRR
jgi:hypothetical protein